MTRSEAAPNIPRKLASEEVRFPVRTEGACEVLSQEENDILTRVGPDTPMGRMMRRFWIPICTAAQVSEPDGAPLRTTLLGENFVVFRDTEGRVGVLDELCVHRGASLALGRNEQGGLRCLYHGWKFCVDGTVLDMPNSRNAKLKQRLRAPAHPVREAGGLVWVYLGPAGQEPPLPHFEFMDGPPENRTVIRVNAAANYLQLFEGGVDSSHVGILHSAQADPAWMHASDGAANGEFGTAEDSDMNLGALAVLDNAPDLELEDTTFGFRCAAVRRGGTDATGAPIRSVRIVPVILPTCRIIPAANGFRFFVFEVPMSDTRTSTYTVVHGPRPADREALLRTLGLADERFWNDRDCDFRATWADGLGQDRALMASNWTGFAGIEQEDVVLSLSMGPILDRSREHMVAADHGVIHLRARLLESVRRSESGQAPIGLEQDDHRATRAVHDTVLAEGQAWQSLPNTDLPEPEPQRPNAMGESRAGRR
ncbi:Rieske 2Fe-2S domain-containing protein [Dactylosporangium sp. NPDC051485]|uniref:Rieske 2Fe-2S domain-containing protein n=1 Tax=Dactylosporangium sp. NPDC051485 TaxID=3154846 RepID=UPI003412DEB5